LALSSASVSPLLPSALLAICDLFQNIYMHPRGYDWRLKVRGFDSSVTLRQKVCFPVFHVCVLVAFFIYSPRFSTTGSGGTESTIVEGLFLRGGFAETLPGKRDSFGEHPRGVTELGRLGRGGVIGRGEKSWESLLGWKRRIEGGEKITFWLSLHHFVIFLSSSAAGGFPNWIFE